MLRTRHCPSVPADGPGQPPERAHQPHRLGQPGRLPVDDRERALRGEVTRAEPGAAGGDDQPGEPVARGSQRVGDRVGAVGRDDPLDDLEARRRSARSSSAAPDRSSRVPSATPSDTVITFASSATRPVCPPRRSRRSAGQWVTIVERSVGSTTTPSRRTRCERHTGRISEASATSAPTSDQQPAEVLLEAELVGHRRGLGADRARRRSSCAAPSRTLSGRPQAPVPARIEEHAEADLGEAEPGGVGEAEHLDDRGRRSCRRSRLGPWRRGRGRRSRRRRSARSAGRARTSRCARGS